ncbi:TPA: FISUMP domain-containing protein, partial [Elizabethkingia anophelis]
NAPNIMSIKPGTRKTLTINFSPKVYECYAYINGWRYFKCHNMGADENADPFVPSAAVHGAKYQWSAYTGQEGRYMSQIDDQTQVTPKLWFTYTLPNNWSDSKGAYDPCPEGYRIPTKAEWQDFIDYHKRNNFFERVGSWQSENNNYSSALYVNYRFDFGRVLMLPAAGMRNAKNGNISSRGSDGIYWSSSFSWMEEPSYMSFNSFDIYTFYNKEGIHIRSIGLPVRCIKKLPNEGGAP